jgi:hypothetical protein
MEIDLKDFTLDVATRTFKSCIDLSPVRTGRFRGNWFPSVGQMLVRVTDDVDKTGEKTFALGRVALSQWVPGDTIYITNSLPYAERLEYGWSKQAPAGVVRLTVQSFNEFINKAAEELR